MRMSKFLSLFFIFSAYFFNISPLQNPLHRLTSEQKARLKKNALCAVGLFCAASCAPNATCEPPDSTLLQKAAISCIMGPGLAELFRTAKAFWKAEGQENNSKNTQDEL